MPQAGRVNRSELRGWIDDALARHDRDVHERGEDLRFLSVDEIVDAVWGRLPLEVRRQTTRAQVQASLTVLTALRGLAVAHPEGEDAGPSQLPGGLPGPP